MLGNGRLAAHCFDGEQRLCHIRGKLRKKVWINTGDIILIGLRDYQDKKADVILKYNAEEARNLKVYGELPESAKINENVGGEDEDFGIEFGEMGDEGKYSDKAESDESSDQSEEDSEEEEETLYARRRINEKKPSPQDMIDAI